MAQGRHHLFITRLFTVSYSIVIRLCHYYRVVYRLTGV
ncbi:hypothetical protein STM14_3622 [Salmonella enterica subsp. enterica serovar Typhimurium str. 14028S]|nr:hypothetical protein SPAB_03738 [Salmonella enterica subsp. enterica serovar Paratyphi B str. SPB7]ACY90031.1 hypothetical protein STM14_3622 [Salmonella enterica subsp. enterica serovar Typhimurium str. 14028S]